MEYRNVRGEGLSSNKTSILDLDSRFASRFRSIQPAAVSSPRGWLHRGTFSFNSIFSSGSSSVSPVSMSLAQSDHHVPVLRLRPLKLKTPTTAPEVICYTCGRDRDICVASGAAPAKQLHAPQSPRPWAFPALSSIGTKAVGKNETTTGDCCDTRCLLANGLRNAVVYAR